MSDRKATNDHMTGLRIAPSCKVRGTVTFGERYTELAAENGEGRADFSNRTVSRDGFFFFWGGGGGAVYGVVVGNMT